MIICFCFCFCSPIISYADDDSERDILLSDFYDNVKDTISPLDVILANAGDVQNYLYYTSIYYIASQDRYYVVPHFINLDYYSNASLSVSDDYTLFEISSASDFRDWTCYYIFNSDYSLYNSQNYYMTSSNNGYLIRSFSLNTQDKFSSSCSHSGEIVVDSVTWCIDGVVYSSYSDPSVLDIDVSFTPSLSGDVTREVTSFVFSPWNAPDLSGSEPASINVSESDTRTSISESFTMTVKNNSRVGAELLFAIVPKGESIHFYGSYSSTPTACSYVYDYSTNPIFVWWSQDWNYFYDSLIPDSITRVDHHLSDSVSSYFSCSEQLSNIPWHFIEKKSTWYHDFSWSQINLKEDSEYSVLVYAVECNYGKASRQCIYSDMDYYVDYSSIELVYSSDFRLVNGYIYNPNDDSFNNIPVGTPSDIVNMGWSSVGYKDPLTGETVIQSRSFNDYADNLNTIRRNAGDEVFIQWTPPSITSNSDYGGLLDNTSNVFSFFSAVFNYFPSGFITIFTIGFWSIIILSIIRRLH